MSQHGKFSSFHWPITSLLFNQFKWNKYQKLLKTHMFQNLLKPFGVVPLPQWCLYDRVLRKLWWLYNAFSRILDSFCKYLSHWAISKCVFTCSKFWTWGVMKKFKANFHAISWESLVILQKDCMTLHNSLRWIEITWDSKRSHRMLLRASHEAHEIFAKRLADLRCVHDAYLMYK